MHKNSSLYILFGIVAIAFGVGIYFYPHMPDLIASHWNIEGQADSYMPKFWGVFFLPLLIVFLWLLFLFFYTLSPLKQKEEEWMKHYFVRFVILLFLFLLYLYLLTTAWNLGYRFNLVQWMAPAFGLFLYYMGILLSHCKRNWFVGIRTPWTMQSEVVWDETHALGGKLFRGAGVLAFLGVFFPAYAIWFILAPLLLAAFLSGIYSYVIYKRQLKLHPEKGKE